MENNHDIDKKFNEASAQALEEPETFPSFEKVWDKIEEKLDKKDSKKRKWAVWIPYGIAASLIIGFGAIYFSKEEKTDTPQRIDSVMAKNTVFPHNSINSASKHVQEIDKTVKSNIKKEMLPAVPVKNLAFEVRTESLIIPEVVGDRQVVEAEPKGYLNMSSIRKQDTLKENSIEEVIAKGIKREKNSVLNSFRTASNDGYPTNVNSVEDTAQSSTLDSFNKREPIAILENKTLGKGKNFIGKNASTQKISNKFLLNSIQGSAPGLSINSAFANLGSGAIVYVKGNGSIENSEPLYIINGTVADSESFKNINTNKIAKITVLKNEAILALYGSKASNGVIIVETKDISKSEKEKIEEIMKKGSEKQLKP